MNLSWHSLYNPTKKHLAVDRGPVYFGKARDCQVLLDNPFVPDRAGCIFLDQTAWTLVALVDGLIRVAGQTLSKNAKVILPDEELIQLRPFTIEFYSAKIIEEPEEALFAKYFLQAQDFISRIHAELLARNRAFIINRDPTQSENPEADVRKIEEDIEAIFGQMKKSGMASGSTAQILAGLYLQGRILHGISQEWVSTLAGRPKPARNEVWQRMLTQSQSYDQQVMDIGRGFSEKLVGIDPSEPEEKLKAVEKGFFIQWPNYCKKLPDYLTDYLSTCYLKKEIKDLVFGLGPLEDLLNLANISEIMVVNHQKIFVEKSGKIQDSGRRFLNEKVAETIIEKIVAGIGKTIDKSRPLADARLKDGSRVNAVIPPIAFSGPCLTIRKFPLKRLSISDLVDQKSLTESCAEFLRAAVLSKRNMIISGGTGTGKTTLLNILGGFIPEQERIITIEDTVEIKLPNAHVVQLEAKESNVEGKGAYTIRDLVKNALRMRPNRIIVGECRGAEALDMLQAMNTGHEGSMTTLHANSSQDAFLRLEVMVQFASTGVSIDSIHQMIGSAVHLIVQLQRLGPKRQITEVTEVLGVDPQDGKLETRQLFHYDKLTGRLGPTGHLPSFMDELLTKKLISEDVFYGMSDFSHA